MRGSAIWFVILTLILCGLAYGTTPRVGHVPQPSLLTGMEDTPTSTPGVIPHHHANTLNDTIVGSQYLAGTTWYDVQTNGTAGKEIAVDADGWVQVVWTNGIISGSATRRVYYNAWDPSSGLFLTETGTQVDNQARAGFTTIALDHRGIGFPVYHQLIGTSTVPHSAYGIDYDPHYGAFFADDIHPHFAGEPQLIWPHADVDINGTLHVVHTDFNAPQLHYYTRGVPVFNTQNHGDSVVFPLGYQDLGDSNTFITVDVAAALHSPRVAMAWLFDPATDNTLGNNVFLKISEDGGLNWGETINVTNFTVIDPNCLTQGGTVETCDKDTLRPWIDLSLLFDQNDNIHVAFSTWPWYYWLNISGVDSVGPWILNTRPSGIWHWDEVHREYSLLADRWYGTLSYLVGANNLMCQRPSLAIDTTTGYLYCSYQMFDTLQYNNTNYMQSDIYMTVSTDGGRFWAEGTDVTQSYGGQSVDPGNSKSERDATLAKFVTGGKVHMLYQFDHDAGSAATTTPEGSPTLNEMYYLRIPTDSIAQLPLIPAYPLHWDSSGMPLPESADHSVLKPGQFALYQNYPNPFNPTTTIQFDLASESVVSLRVFDVLGREVTTLLNKQHLTAGVQMVSFDASGLSSGVYFYRLESPKMTQTRKMVVMK